VVSKIIINKHLTKDKIAFILICAYAFMIPLGTVFRFTSEEGSLGISTILLTFLVIVYIPTTVPILLKNKVFFLLLLLVLWFSLSTLFALDSVISGYKMLAILTVYIFFASTITKIHLPANRLKIFFLWLTIGMFFSSSLTLIDFLGVTDIPYANESNIYTQIGDENIAQASGFFPRRSAMAAYFTLIWPALFILINYFQGKLLKIYVVITCFTSLVILSLTHNLTGIIAIFITCSVYLLCGDHINLVKRMKRIVCAVLIILSFFCIVVTYFPDIINVYLFRLRIPTYVSGIAVEEVEHQKESDNTRIFFLKHSLKSLVNNPVGHGYTKIWTEKYGFKDPHNIITQIIWGAGIFSFIWLSLFACVIINLTIKKNTLNKELFPYYDALRFGLLSWFITGMAHTIICTGLAWIFFGMLLNIRYQCTNINRL